MRAPHATAIRRGKELLAVILYSIYYYIILYTIIYRAPRVANGNIHFLLHAAVHPGLHCTEFDGWTLIGCYVTHVTQWPRCWTLIGCHHASSREIRVKVQIFELEQIFRATNSRERAHLCTTKVWREKSKNARWGWGEECGALCLRLVDGGGTRPPPLAPGSPWWGAGCHNMHFCIHFIQLLFCIFMYIFEQYLCIAFVCFILHFISS